MIAVLSLPILLLKCIFDALYISLNEIPYQSSPLFDFVVGPDPVLTVQNSLSL